MKIQIALVLVLSVLNAHGFLFGESETWDDLKVTWGINPLSSGVYASMPRNVNDAIAAGWKLEKSCGQVNGNRYILNGDRAVLLVFDTTGKIAGIATSFPKNLPFNFPSKQQADYMTEEADSWVLTAYFTDPSTVCKRKEAKVETGDRLVIKGDGATLDIARNEANLNKMFTKSGCFPSMGRHYWADVTGMVNENTQAENFLPFFILYNSGELNGFGWALNADLSSSRFEHPPKNALSMFFSNGIPKWFTDPSKAGTLSTMHIYLDSTPLLNFC